MSALRVRGSLAAHLPDPAELGPPPSRATVAPEEARLAPIAPMRAIARGDRAEAPDSRTLATLDATASRLADLDALSRALRPDLAALLGDRRDAIAGLARELRALSAELAELDRARAALGSV